MTPSYRDMAILRLKQAKTTWGLLDDGDITITHSSILQPVIYAGVKAMLKIAFDDEERRGGALMACWNGNGAAKVFKHNQNALLLERGSPHQSLRTKVISGEEDEANRIICSVAAKLHRTACNASLPLIPLSEWFRALFEEGAKYGGIFNTASNIAAFLLETSPGETALHGDLHYDNIICSPSGTWGAIDPKALKGERAFDLANLFCNPTPEIATSTERLAKQAKFIANEAHLDIKRLLQWITAWACLSATWILQDGEDASTHITVAKNASGELSRI